VPAASVLPGPSRSVNMDHGWVEQTLDVDLTSGKGRTRDVMPAAREWLRGHPLATRVAWEEIPPGAGALAPENLIGCATLPSHS
jgi:aldehyde:ferredoxin oxidoreductase